MKEQNFKQTEIGKIPVDWEVKYLGETLAENPKYGINAASVPFNSNIPTYLRITDISDEGLYLNNSPVSVNHNESSKYFLEEGDLVFARTGASVGKTYLYNLDDGKLVYAGFLIKLKSDVLKLNPVFLKYLTQNKFYKDWIIQNSMRTGQPGINGIQIKSFQIPLPPLAEQEKIAEVLSDTDLWIESTEALLAKKRQIKKGAMQKLLSPKEDWEVKKLGEVLQFGSGRDYKHLQSGDIPVYGTGGIMTYVNQYLYDGESVGIGRKGTIDKPVLLKNKFWTVDTLFFTHSFIDAVPKYIYYQFLLIKWKEYNEASGVPSLNKNTLEQVEIKIPSLKIQQEIAEILSSMDLEIESLENRLQKARNIKQGMMQDLLTGKVRLG